MQDIVQKGLKSTTIIIQNRYLPHALSQSTFTQNPMQRQPRSPAHWQVLSTAYLSAKT
jgi:hypothetical protein